MQRVYVHPLPVRLWHWTNAVGFVLMILTGVQLRYVGLIDVISFRAAVQLHQWIGVALIANFLIWFCFYLFTDKITVYHPELNPRKQFIDSFRQVLYYGYGMFKGDPNPHHISAYAKFNAVQSILYQVVMLLLVPIQFYTGILLWDVKRFSAQVEFLGGIRVVDTIHVLIFIFFVSYLMIHPYLGTLGASRAAQYKAMWTGYEELPDDHAPAAEAAPGGAGTA